VYEVHFEKAAENDLKRLPTTTFHRIIPQIRALAENPRPLGCRKLTSSKNDWRISQGSGVRSCNITFMGLGHP
jgi:mRNA interferase RelE/StbE